MQLQKELSVLFQARIPVVNIVSYEENRVIREIVGLAQSKKWSGNEGVYSWDIADQFACHVEGNPDFDRSKPATVDTILQIIEQFEGGGIFILKDFHHIWEARKSVIRKLRNLSISLAVTLNRKSIVLLTPERCLPPELVEDVICLEYGKPDMQEMEEILERAIGRTGALDEMSMEFRSKVVKTALGLSDTQAMRVLRKAVVLGRDGRLDESCIDLITREKQSIIRASGALEFHRHTEPEKNIGGLAVLKKWLDQRRDAFGEDAREYGLDPPGGLALIGIPGTGKSLCAKMAAFLWRLPLLRLDMGAVFGGILGTSERNIREAIRISEIISPSILWVDEIEKAFAGSTGDSGTAARVLATFLTWMAERQHPVFVFATANNVERLPMEFLRKGRFDEVFFLDLPTSEERRQIVEVHLKKRGYSMTAQRFDLEKIARETEGFVGAELEAMVKDAMFPAFKDNRRELTDQDLCNAAHDIVPLAKSHASIIERLRNIVKDGLARNASAAEPRSEVQLESIRGGRLIDFQERQLKKKLRR